MLTVKQIEAAKPKDKAFRLADSGGLFLFIPPTGKKVWRLRYRFGGKEKTLVIGPYPEISLLKARALQSEAKLKIASGEDPSAHKQAGKMSARLNTGDTFGDIFSEWHSHKTAVWSRVYADEIMSMFTNDILPLIGNLRIDEIEPLVILRVIRLYEDRGAMSRADKARRRCGEVFRYAIITGRAKYNPAPDLVDALKGYRKENFPFLPMHKIPEFNRALMSYSGSVIPKNATLLLQYTALRTIELRTLKWENIDFDGMFINVDPAIMKGRRLHVVPMSSQVASLLNSLKLLTGMYEYVFTGRTDKNKPISENTILGVIRRIGYQGQASGHGFRHQFSTVLNENNWNVDAIEAQLAHVNSAGTRGVYNHAKYMDTRKKMMQWWADWIDEGFDSV
ncbi:Integrase [Izhakiella capsodis]|uniref:Integrase n=1 Tax=Izhakiella capsodis TaxID=1367852 RepID=A0A1I4WJ24_9GAMM|nr:tyrosine-type recombinase/integrase [Izhakiella capsodis]SFN13457.1 Integrase [Izhakiella capsodis]